ncbi:MAG: metal-dependent hydrolase [Betaproteobacteria bacterium]|jgi:L-ascorbate metabolism protein UlaG (beta-lactamase superfamily)|nr:metal-dependent hydrolase [Betaproteobacteria bacterium]
MRSSRFFSVVALVLAVLSVPAASAAQQGKTELLWLGQSAMRITTPSGKVIMLDPWLTTNPKTPEGYKNLDAIGKIDLILVTHGHGDHLGDAPALAKKHNVPMWGPAGMNQSLQTLGVLSPELAPRMNKGGTITPFPNVNIRITMVHAEHSSELVLPNAQGKPETHVGGEPVGFIIELENGFRIYHMGDTGLFGDMALIGRLYKPDLILIPIGGHFVMDPKDAAYATNEWLKPKSAIPVHYGTIPQLRGTPEEYKKALGSSSTAVITMNPGEQVTF